MDQQLHLRTASVFCFVQDIFTWLPVVDKQHTSRYHEDLLQLKTVVMRACEIQRQFYLPPYILSMWWR